MAYTMEHLKLILPTRPPVCPLLLKTYKMIDKYRCDYKISFVQIIAIALVQVFLSITKLKPYDVFMNGWYSLL